MVESWGSSNPRMTSLAFALSSVNPGAGGFQVKIPGKDPTASHYLAIIKGAPSQSTNCLMVNPSLDLLLFSLLELYLFRLRQSVPLDLDLLFPSVSGHEQPFS